MDGGTEPTRIPGGRYAAFISYSHAGDGKLAPAVQKGLQRLAKPLWSRRALDVFRDETGLSVNASLWASICEAMDSSQWFVLMASPEAAASEWVGREIVRWVEVHGASRILPVVTDGTWVWDEARNDFDWERSTAVHPALRGVFASEPRHLDMTWARHSDQLTLRNGRFRDQVAELAAPMHGKPKDAIEGDDVRLQRTTRRLAIGALAGLAALTATSVAGGSMAVVNQRTAVEQRDRADERAREALSRRLAQLDVRGDDRSLPYLLAAEAYRQAPTAEAQGALIERLSAASQGGSGDRLVGHEGGVRATATARDGQRIATIDASSVVRLFDRAATGDPIEVAREANAIAFTPSGSLVVATADRLAWIDGDGEETDGAEPGGPIAAIAPTGDAQEVAAVRADGRIVRFAPGDEPTEIASSSVDDPTFIATVEAGLLVSSANGQSVVVDDDGEVASSWLGAGPTTDVSPDGTLTAEIISELAYGERPIAVAHVREVATGEVAWTTYVFEPYRPQVALFLADDELAVATFGGVDGAPSQLFVSDEMSGRGGQTSTQVPGELPRTISTGSAAGGIVTLGGDDPVATTVQLASSGGFGGDVMAPGWVASYPPSATLDGFAVVTDGATMGLLDVSTSEVRSLEGTEAVATADGGNSGLAAVSPQGRWMLLRDGRVVDLDDGEVIDLGTPNGSLRVRPSWSADERRVAYVVDEGTPEHQTAPASEEPNRRVMVVDIDSRTGAEVVASGDLCRNSCNERTSIALDPNGSRLVLRGLTPSDSDAQPSGPVEVFEVAAPDAPLATRALGGPGPVGWSADGTTVWAHDGTSVQTLDPDGLEPRSNAVTDAIETWQVSPDGSLVATGGCEVGLLDPASWTVVARFGPETSYGEAGCDDPSSVAWTDDGATLLTGHSCLVRADDCALESWNLDPEALYESACRLAGRNLTQDEWAQFLPDWPYERTCPEFGDGPAPGAGATEGGASPSVPGGGSTADPDPDPDPDLPPDEFGGGGGSGWDPAPVPDSIGPGDAPFVLSIVQEGSAFAVELGYGSSGVCEAGRKPTPGIVCLRLDRGPDDTIEVSLMVWTGDSIAKLTFQEGEQGWVRIGEEVPPD